MQEVRSQLNLQMAQVTFDSLTRQERLVVEDAVLSLVIPNSLIYCWYKENAKEGTNYTDLLLKSKMPSTICVKPSTRLLERLRKKAGEIHTLLKSKKTQRSTLLEKSSRFILTENDIVKCSDLQKKISSLT